MGLNAIAQRPCVYFDACIAIYYVERNGMRYPTIRSQLFPTDRAKPLIAFSDLVRLECRIAPLRRHDLALLARFDEFFQVTAAINIELDTKVFDLATELRARHGLKTPDALHLAAAISGGCDTFWTHDDRLNRAAEHYLNITIF